MPGTKEHELLSLSGLVFAIDTPPVARIHHRVALEDARCCAFSPSLY